MPADVVAIAQPRMLVLARESRGWKQGDVAKAMKALDGDDSKVSQAYVSRAESGKLPVSGDRLDLYANALGYPAELLTLERGEIGAGAGLIHHRKQQAVAAPELRRIHAILNLTRVQLAGLLDGVPRSIEAKIPQIAVDDYLSPEEAADELRAEWGLPGGPIDSIIAILEAAGGLVLARSLVAPAPLNSGNDSVPVDAVSSCTPGEDPIVLLNAGTPGDRQRFTLAHELGHMVMHTIPHPDQEKQANRFAAQLLMPAKDIRANFQGAVDLRLLLSLKEQWHVSMWALLRRAHTLDEISDWQYRTLAVQMASLGYRTTEPSSLDPEQPVAVRAAVDWRLDHGSDVDSLARAALLRPEEFTCLYLGSTTRLPISTITAEVRT
ncbi:MULTISPECIES: XRE family transcriptional regulator [unclassified Crossiella]|uniref:ImmA/IrrE family metallo-endopeptidase n=1 Tax=unclassified Crossiella TaxID=2620835 RepID=UPI001FFE7E12|nr:MULTISPECIES: XRE family transcriptional regulator [unclassified Crossiella]MCK2241841.1 XRE family transcriptional regulator [Crossiella sp. S99.2]MCK2255744.1 XRE family transcriptional regulator [Crossiella sp. S99.1]